MERWALKSEMMGSEEGWKEEKGKGRGNKGRNGELREEKDVWGKGSGKRSRNEE